MPDIKTRIFELHAFESLASGHTAAHRLHPFAKIFSAIVFIVCVASFGRYDFARLAPYLFYPFVIAALAEAPYRLLLPRMLVALPFCLFAGLSNALLDRAAAFMIGGVTVSYGAVSLATIILKMYLCVMAALLLAATTPFAELSAQLRRMRVPAVFVVIFEMTFRYIGVLFEEAHSMVSAYRLRSGGKKALDMRHMGPFAGQLLLRGFDRAERVYAAMCCRGYSLNSAMPAGRRLKGRDIAAMAAVCLPSLLLRFIKII